MTIVNKIASALEHAVLTAPGLPAVHVENVRFDPSEDDSFIKTTVVPTSVLPAVVGPGPQQRYEGLFNLLVCVPQGVGAGHAHDYVDRLMELFAPSTDINHGGIVVSIDTSEPALGYYEAPFYCVPVSVGWHIYS